MEASNKSGLKRDELSDDTDCDDSHCDDIIYNLPKRKTMASTFKVMTDCSRQLFGRVKQAGKTYIFND